MVAMTCDRCEPSSLMRSIGSLDAFVAVLAADLAAGWLAGAVGGACWACRAKTGSKPAPAMRHAVVRNRFMAASLRKG